MPLPLIAGGVDSGGTGRACALLNLSRLYHEVRLGYIPPLDFEDAYLLRLAFALLVECGASIPPSAFVQLGYLTEPANCLSSEPNYA